MRTPRPPQPPNEPPPTLEQPQIDAPAVEPPRRAEPLPPIEPQRIHVPAPATAMPQYGDHGEPTVERPRHMRPSDARGDEADTPRRSRFQLPDVNRVYLIALAPVVVLALLVVAWAVDTTVLSGQVQRNVTMAGLSIGGTGEDDLPEVVAKAADDLAARPVEIKADGKTYQTTAAALGLTLDQEETVDAALDVGNGDSLLVRPFKWLASFFSSREVPLRYKVSELETAAELQRLQGTDLTQPVDPSIQLAEGSFVVAPGHPGTGIDAAEIAEKLPQAAEEQTEGTITIRTRKTEVQPRFTNESAQLVADQANTMTQNGLTLKAGTATAAIGADQLRAWIAPTVTEAGFQLNFDTEAAKAAAPTLFADLGAEPKDATVVLQGGAPVVVPGQDGVVCCGDDAGTRIWDALNANQPEVELQAVVTPPEHTTEEVQGWGIAQPVGGSRAWADGVATDGPGPGFTTYHACCAPRVTNIQRIADLVRGAVIPPGGTFSVNEHVGPRTAAKGFVPAGAIREGQHVDEIGGGVSQFATTLFNAAYFAGLDITTYQAHTEYFTRYPRGREATMGYPSPDLVIKNNTPYGVLIQTSYTGTSLTITLYSTPYATAEQTNISETDSGACKVVTTTRTRTFPDGTTQQDRFRATYRPGEGMTC